MTKSDALVALKAQVPCGAKHVKFEMWPERHGVPTGRNSVITIRPHSQHSSDFLWSQLAGSHQYVDTKWTPSESLVLWQVRVCRGYRDGSSDVAGRASAYLDPAHIPPMRIVRPAIGIDLGLGSGCACHLRCRWDEGDEKPGKLPIHCNLLDLSRATHLRHPLK